MKLEPVLHNHVAIVTGAGRSDGIGYAVAHQLASLGARLVVTDLNADVVAARAAELPAVDAPHGGIAADIADEAAVDGMVKQVVAQYGRIDILVNNAGICITQPLIETPLQAWELTMRVNAQGTFLASVAVARQLITQGHGGSIINMASISGKEGWPNFGSYTASKFAVVGLTQTLARELAVHQIRVNAVCPGLINTSLNSQILGELSAIRHTDATQIEDAQLSRVPLGRYGTPADIAQTVGFLVSPAAAYITGQAINVCGGLMVAR